MKIISKSLLWSSAFSLVLPQTAFLSSAYASLVDTSQNQAFESKPAQFLKLAAVHFIANDGGLKFGGSNPGGQEFNPGDLCKSRGYLHKGCPAGYIPGEACTEDSSFVKECIDPDTWCRGNGYNVTSCTLPKYLSGKCPHSSTLYKSCETDNARACRDAGYASSCEVGKIGDRACPYDSKYKTCVCNPCAGFAYTSAQASAQGYVPGEVCNSCGTMKYKRSEAPCDGFKTCDCGGATGAKTCWSGTVKKFDTCKECCDSKFQYDSSNCSGDFQLAGNSCGGKYDKCIKPGLILYSDHTTSRQYLPEKTAIGVVIDEDKKIAAAINNFSYDQARLESCVKNSSNNTTVDASTGERRPLTSEEINSGCSYNSVNAKGEWGNYPNQDDATQADIPGLENCDGCSLSCTVASGKDNTAKIIAYGQSRGLTFKAAEFAYNYQPAAGCPSGSWCGRGNWYLPSIHELKTFYDNRGTTKNTLKLIPGAQNIVFDLINPSGYMSSTETFDSNPYRQNGSCMFYMEDGSISFAKKNMWAGFILPMIKY